MTAVPIIFAASTLDAVISAKKATISNSTEPLMAVVLPSTSVARAAPTSKAEMIDSSPYAATRSFKASTS
jgi:hypothetical protein